MTATLDTAADSLVDVVTADPTTDTVSAPASTRESRAAARAAMTEAERGQYTHAFVWATVGLLISLAGFGFVAMRDGAANHATTTSVSSTTTP
jgi:hypothetical protein